MGSIWRQALGSSRNGNEKNKKQPNTAQENRAMRESQTQAGRYLQGVLKNRTGNRNETHQPLTLVSEDDRDLVSTAQKVVPSLAPKPHSQ
jgi:hypothetical protein